MAFDSDHERETSERKTLIAKTSVAMEKAAATATAKEEFKVQKQDALMNLTLNDSTELWLLKWPLNQPPDFDGQEVTLKLHQNGQLGSFESSSGKSYDMVSFNSADSGGMVILPSASNSKFVGKISRHVSLVHYQEAAEMQTHDKLTAKLIAQRSSATSLTNSNRRSAAPTQTIRPRNFQASNGTASTPSSRSRSSKSYISGSLESSKSSKRKHVDEPTSSIGGNQSDRDSGKGHSTVTSTGSFDQTPQRKSKNKKRT